MSQRLPIAIAVAFCTMLPPALLAPVGEARGMPTQISTEFERVSREVAKRFAAQALRAICGDGEAHEVCEVLVDGVVEIFELVVDGNATPETVTAALTTDIGRLARSAVVWAARDGLDDLLAALSGGHTQAEAAGRELESDARALMACLIARSHDGGRRADAQCSASASILERDERGAIATRPTASAAGYTAEETMYAASVVLTQLVNIVEHASAGGVFATVRSATDALAILGQATESASESGVFYDELLDPLTAPGAWEGCSGGAQVSATISAWRQQRFEVLAALGKAVAGGYTPSSELLAAIPAELPLVRCPPNSPAAAALSELRMAAAAFRVDVRWSAQAERWALPALLGAALVDAIAGTSARRQREHLGTLALEVIGRGIGAADEPGWRCTAEATTTEARARTTRFSCVPLLAPEGTPPVHVALPGEQDEASERAAVLLEARYSRRAARYTCVYQAAAAALGASWPEDIDTHGYCRLPTAFRGAVAGTALAHALEPVDEGIELHRWAPGVYQRLPGKRSRLALGDGVSLQMAFGLAMVAADALADMAKDLPAGDRMHMALLTRGLSDAFSLLLDGREEDGLRAILTLGAAFLRPYVSQMLDAALAPLETCTNDDDAARSIACAVRLLGEAVYDPAVALLTTAQPSAAEQRRLYADVLRRLEELDPLSRTPLLFNVGLGATMLAGPGGGPSAHFTVVDKLGLAWRWGDRNQWEVGGFVGGFLDAVVREVTDAEDTAPFWLAGAALGVRQVAPDWPFGIELHAAAALPFSLARVPDHTSLAVGISLIVPADAVFGGP